MSSTNALDRCVISIGKALERDKVCAPSVLLSLATGLDLLPERLEDSGSIDLQRYADIPETWRDSTLFYGRLGWTPVWVLEDKNLDPRLPDGGKPAWEAALPIWLAARAGATTLLHASACAALESDAREVRSVGSLAILRDHLNFSGESPLIGMGTSQLGPLFPDTTHLHDPVVRAAALSVAEQRGLAAFEAIAACLPAPHLDTPAEHRFYARAGADVAVQGLATPLLAAAHAGLGVCAISAVTDLPGERLDIKRLLERAELVAPSLEELLIVLCAELAQRGVFEEDQV